MSAIGTAHGEALVMKFGDGGAPEAFAASASINTTRSVKFTTDAAETVVPDSANPSKPGYKLRRARSRDIAFDGAGVTDVTSFSTLLQIWNRDDPTFNGQVIQDVVGGWMAQGPWLILSLETSGEARGEEQAFSISVAAAGQMTITYP
jgi:predicted secreted protein